jgi:hypothetical protein
MNDWADDDAADADQATQEEWWIERQIQAEQADDAAADRYAEIKNK